MPAYSSKDQAAAVFSRLFEIMLEDPGFGAVVRERSLSVRFVHTKPDFELFVDGDGVRVDGPPASAAITIKMSCDTADALWTGRLLMPVAVATGRIRIRGSVATVIEFVPQLQPAFDRYPELAAAAGVPTSA
jgi:putative sterol carrier protein